MAPLPDLLKAFQDLSPQSRASLKASSWQLVDQEMDTTSTDPEIGGPAGSINKKVTIVGNGEENEDGVVELGSYGIRLKGSTLTTGNGGDTFVGVGKFAGVSLRNSAINMGDGNDTINGEGVFTTLGTGITVGDSVINMGKGNDTINGEGDNAGVQVSFNSAINMGDGNDTINGESGNVGVSVSFNSAINMGDGNDTINGEGGNIGVSVAHEDSAINMGEGNDAIIGAGDNNGVMLFSYSTIDMGSGNDTVDALVGGFVGDGFINFDEGDDTLIGSGFGSGISFNGGGGDRDKVVLGDGIYTYGDEDDGFGPYLSDGSDRMSIVDFELIGGTAGTAEDEFGTNANIDGSESLVFGETYKITGGYLIVV